MIASSKKIKDLQYKNDELTKKLNMACSSLRKVQTSYRRMKITNASKQILNHSI